MSKAIKNLETSLWEYVWYIITIFPSWILSISHIVIRQFIYYRWFISNCLLRTVPILLSYTKVPYGEDNSY